MRKLRLRFATPNNFTGEAFYEIIGDYELIEASFAQQYGIRLRRENDMSWDEFITLLSGLNGDTPLGHIVSIRAEKDKDRIKRFTPEEKKIRNDWVKRHRHIVSDKKEVDKAMNDFLSMFKSISKGG